MRHTMLLLMIASTATLISCAPQQQAAPAQPPVVVSPVQPIEPAATPEPTTVPEVQLEPTTNIKPEPVVEEPIKAEPVVVPVKIEPIMEPAPVVTPAAPKTTLEPTLPAQSVVAAEPKPQPIVVVAPKAPEPLVLAGPQPAASFESGEVFVHLSGSNVKVTSDSFAATHGKLSNKIVFSDKGYKCALYSKPNNAPYDFSGKTKLTFDLYAQQNAKLEIVVKAGPTWSWKSVKDVLVREGQNKVSIMLSDLGGDKDGLGKSVPWGPFSQAELKEVYAIGFGQWTAETVQTDIYYIDNINVE